MTSTHEEPDRDDADPVRGLSLGVMLGVVFWGVFLLVVFACVRG